MLWGRDDLVEKRIGPERRKKVKGNGSRLQMQAAGARSLAARQPLDGGRTPRES